VNKRFLWIGAVISLVIIVLLIRSYKNIDLIKRTKQPDVVSELLNSAKEFEAKTDLQAAKAIYKRLLSEYPNSEQVSQWQKKIEDLNIKLLFSPVITKGSIGYQINPGDTLYKIAKQFNTTVDLIMKSNSLKTDKIFPGKKIKIYNLPFSIVVDKSQNTLILKSNEEIVKTYVISTGLHNSTPIGSFKIKDKLIDPPWFKEGKVIPAESPENILGSRWLGFDLAGYGIHGTNDPKTLGQHITQGCVRMSNRDVEELYTIVHIGTEVIIVE